MGADWILFVAVMALQAGALAGVAVVLLLERHEDRGRLRGQESLDP